MVLGIRGIEDSWVYQDIFAKGRAEGQVEEARAILLGLGRKKFGEPQDPVVTKIMAINDADQLNRLLNSIFDAGSWEDLVRSTDQ